MWSIKVYLIFIEAITLVITAEILLILSFCGVGWGGVGGVGFAKSFYGQTQPCVEVRLGFCQLECPDLHESCQNLLEKINSSISDIKI